jgi:hypothetical protein
MKRLIIFALLCIMGMQANGQMIIRDNISIRDTIRLERYNPESESFAIAKLAMAPGDHRLKDPSKAETLRSQGIVRVELVYSDFPVGEDFRELNRMRMLELYKFLPNAFNDAGIKWSVVVQTGVAKTGNIGSYFHGFVVHYRPYHLSYEVSSIEGVLKGKHQVKDSTVLKVLERNREWKDMLVVADVTGSMNPYTAQLILWLKLNTGSGRAKHFTFFNDGDDKPNFRKEKGKTGGIYSVRSNEYNVVAVKAIEAMRKGNGGDMQENDVEALIKGIKDCDECKNIVLIADNLAPVRDIELIKEVKKPVKVILCGTAMGINTQYLDIARATGGSIHTMESDLTNLIKLNEGSIIEVDGQKFKIVKGSFVQVKET